MVNEEMTSQSKLIPVLREGVDIIKMIVFMELKGRLAGKHADRDAAYVSKLSGAVLNTLFGTPNDQEPFAGFVKENRAEIQTEVGVVATDLEHLRIPVTDALRVQFLCDSLEGIESEDILEKALFLGILIEDRAVPLPKTFMQLVRKLGVAHKVLDPATIPDSA